MASSPGTADRIDVARDAQSLFSRSLRELDDRLLRGEPFSGHERNCVFLNTGGERWATISHVSGFDFDDDARGIAATDWDGDGDVDFWVSNRTAPAVRYLRNDCPRSGRFLTLRLTQDTGNRDAIGARVEVKLAGSPAPLLREVRAGDSFLAQSSKTLHFGLGTAAKIESVTVRWPADKTETFTGIAPDASFLLRKGTGKATPLPAHSGIRKPEALPVALPEGEFPVAVPLAHSIPVPPVPFTGLDAKPRLLSEIKGPVLVNLCSGDYEPCAKQLDIWAAALPELTAAGLTILAAGMDDEKETRALLAKQPEAMQRGLLTAHGRERLAYLYNLPFEIELELSAPCSFLLDARHRLIVVYRGAVGPAQLLADLKRASLSPAEQFTAAAPMSGVWFRQPVPWQPLEFFTTMLRQSDWQAAHTYMSTNREEFRKSRRYPDACLLLGDSFTNFKQPAAAVPYYRDYTKARPADAGALNNFAYNLITQPNPKPEDLTEAITAADKAVELTKRQNAAVLDTLARVLLASGKKPQAAKVATHALTLPDATPDIAAGLKEILQKAAQ